MGYRIEYGYHKRRLWPYVLLAVVLAAALLPRQVLEKLLVPGDIPVTKAAAAALLEDMRQGIPAGEAVTAFCKAIVQGASFG